MKIVFEKLKTSNENIYVDFGDGTWKEFSVESARTNGIHIPSTCNDYSKIKIKGSTSVFNNANVVTGIKRYETTGEPYIYLDIYKSDITISTGSSGFAMGRYYGLYVKDGDSSTYFHIDGSMNDTSKYENISEDGELPPYRYAIDIGSEEYYFLNDDQVRILNMSSKHYSENSIQYIYDENNVKTYVDIDGERFPVIEDSQYPIVSVGSGRLVVDAGSNYVWPDEYILQSFQADDIIDFGSLYYFVNIGSSNDYGVDAYKRVNSTKDPVDQIAEDFQGATIYYYISSGSGYYYPTNFRLNIK